MSVEQRPIFPIEKVLTTHDPVAAPVESAALRATLVAFARTQQRAAEDPYEIGRWENEGGRPGVVASRESRARVRRERERRAWKAQAVSEREIAGALGAYTRELRRAGVPLESTLSAVSSVVRAQLTALVPRDVLAAVQRDAVRSVLVAYFGP